MKRTPTPSEKPPEILRKDSGIGESSCWRGYALKFGESLDVSTERGEFKETRPRESLGRKKR